MSNEKFLDLALDPKQKGNRQGKGFNAVGSKNIVKEFTKKTGFEFLQFKPCRSTGNQLTNFEKSSKTWIRLPRYKDIYA